MTFFFTLFYFYTKIISEVACFSETEVKAAVLHMTNAFTFAKKLSSLTYEHR